MPVHAGWALACGAEVARSPWQQSCAERPGPHYAAQLGFYGEGVRGWRWRAPPLAAKLRRAARSSTMLRTAVGVAPGASACSFRELRLQR